MKTIFVTGGTGYLGRPLLESLLAAGHTVLALARPGSQAKLPAGVRAVLGSALDEASFADAIPAGAVIVHLVGTPHPSPSKAAEFLRVDLGSIRATTGAAVRAGASHLVYVSVAHPAPVMKAYVAARVDGETLVRGSGIPATILRPWYVLGPGHRWPWVLVPLYAVCRSFPPTREGAERLGLVSRREMNAALLLAAVGEPPGGVRIVEVRDIRQGYRGAGDRLASGRLKP